MHATKWLEWCQSGGRAWRDMPGLVPVQSLAQVQLFNSFWMPPVVMRMTGMSEYGLSLRSSSWLGLLQWRPSRTAQWQYWPWLMGCCRQDQSFSLEPFWCIMFPAFDVLPHLVVTIFRNDVHYLDVASCFAYFPYFLLDIAQPKKGKWISFPSQFSPFNCCLDVVWWLDGGDCPENSHVVFCPSE